MAIVPCGIDGNSYGFPLIDCYDKEIMAEAFSRRCRALEAEQVILEAVCRRFPEGQVPEGLTLVLRVDRGGQFIAGRIRKLAAFLGLHLEVCGIQTPNDKPDVESFISCYKTEEVYRNQYRNFAKAHAAWKDYISWYNRQRLHGALDYRPPAEVAPVLTGTMSLKTFNRLASCQAKSSTITTPF